LRQGGADVVLIARPEHAAAIADHGLALRAASGTEFIDVAAVTSLAQLRPDDGDVVLVASKTQDTPIIHDALVDWNPAVPVICATNGVEHERAALRRFPNVYAMVVQLPAQFERAGEVTLLCAPTNALLDVGRYPSGIDDVAIELSALIDGSPRMSSEPDPDVMTKKYGKLLINLGNAADAICGLGGRHAKVVSAAIAEGERAFAAAGIRWEPQGARAESYRTRGAEMRFDVPVGDTFVGGSTWQSLMKGASSVETDYFNGEVLLLSRLQGLGAPANEFLQQYMARLVRKELPPGALTVEQLDLEWRSWTEQLGPR
jgi:2-dehydropantoate 2-reductase